MAMETSLAAHSSHQAPSAPLGNGKVAGHAADSLQGRIEPALVDGDYRRACWDDKCMVRATCRLWTERDAPGFAIRAMTWRAHWRCFDLPCDNFVPEAQ